MFNSGGDTEMMYRNQNKDNSEATRRFIKKAASGSAQAANGFVRGIKRGKAGLKIGFFLGLAGLIIEMATGNDHFIPFMDSSTFPYIAFWFWLVIGMGIIGFISGFVA